VSVQDPPPPETGVPPLFRRVMLIRARKMPGLAIFCTFLTGFCEKPAGFLLDPAFFTPVGDSRIWQSWD